MGRTLHHAGEVHAKGGEFTIGRNFPILKLQLTSGLNKVPPDNFVASTRAVHLLHSRERKSVLFTLPERVSNLRESV